MFAGYPSGCPSVVRPSVNINFTWRDVSILSGRISMKLAKNIHHVSGNCRFFSRSEIKGQSHMYKCVNAITAEAYISTIRQRSKGV